MDQYKHHTIIYMNDDLVEWYTVRQVNLLQLKCHFLDMITEDLQVRSLRLYQILATV